MIAEVDPGEQGIREFWKQRKRETNRRRTKATPLKWNKVVALRRALSDAQGQRCYYCRVTMTPAEGRRGYDPRMETLEHLDEVCAGGTWTKENCVAACNQCNNLRAVLLSTARRLEAALTERRDDPNRIHHLAERLATSLARWDAAIAAGSGTAKTPQAVECEASQSGPQGIAQPPSAITKGTVR